MKPLIIFPPLLPYLLMSLILLTSCTTSPLVSRVIIEDAQRLVRLDVTYRTGGQQHSHPANLPSAEVASLLNEVKVRPESLMPGLKGNQEEEKAFSHAQIEFLAHYLAVALEKATPLEEILFYWNQTRDQNIQEITSGSVFLNEETLHLLFANYRWATSGKLDAKRVKNNPLTVLGNPRYELSVDDNDSVSYDRPWLMFNPNSPQHLIISYKDHLKRSRKGGKEQSTMTESANDYHDSIREKLKSLEALRKEGLIAEDEYQEKRRQVLERL